MKTAQLVDRLDAELDTAAYADVDASPNGLQIGSRSGTVETVGCAVDAAAATFEFAISAGVDMLCTHHGVIWDGIERITGRSYDLVSKLARAELDLYVSHLPLDGHQTLGNAAGLASYLDVTSTSPFGEIAGLPIGQAGQFDQSTSLDRLASSLEALPTGGGQIRTFPFGPSDIKTVAIVTGSGADFLDQAATAGVDVYITGEGKQKLYHEAREREMNVILSGHYATETFGIENLASEIEQWGVDTQIFTHPTGL
ncbi:MAG: dinuclear metal center protein, YbgI/SA1388 family [Haloquadratum sp. J07HQX50]|nr:MAG: dinuclear metal center protein, YbgI/SA1388 family [Haloquadratum sp. J07HQX50]